MGSLSFLQRIFPTQESNQGLLHWPVRRGLKRLNAGLLILAFLLLWSVAQAQGPTVSRGSNKGSG